MDGGGGREGGRGWGEGPIFVDYIAQVYLWVELSKRGAKL